MRLSLISVGPLLQKCLYRSRARCRTWRTGAMAAAAAATVHKTDLEIEIGHPVHQVEETERGGEEDACVRVYLGDADVHPAVPPGAGAAVLEAAEEAGAVLPVQALVAVLLVPLLHVRGVVHLDGRGRAGADVDGGLLLFDGNKTTQLATADEERRCILKTITRRLT